ncbi:hypothetical protein EAF00_000564 [Botryotinia globosa]|nr:hypothetical protein EAF00_000564 [Botryotinia globosa]
MVPSPEPVTPSHYSYDPSFSAAIVVGILYSQHSSLLFSNGSDTMLRYGLSWLLLLLWKKQVTLSEQYPRNIVSKKSIYVVQTALIVLSPVLMTAKCYIIFGDIICHIVPKETRTTKLLWSPPRFITPISVIRDIREYSRVAFLLQLICVVRITSIDITSADAQSKLSKGKNIALVGVAIQMAYFGLFSTIVIRFNFASRRFASDFQQRITLPNNSESKIEKYVTIDGAEKKLKPNWQALLHVVNITCVLILIRSVFRMVDFALGRTGYTEEGGW